MRRRNRLHKENPSNIGLFEKVTSNCQIEDHFKRGWRDFHLNQNIQDSGSRQTTTRKFSHRFGVFWIQGRLDIIILVLVHAMTVPHEDEND